MFSFLIIFLPPQLHTHPRVCVRAYTRALVCVCVGAGGAGVIGVNLLWQDVALLPHESD